MKYIVTLILSLIFILIYSSYNSNDKSTKVIIAVPNLTDLDINQYLKNEFNNLANIDFVDGSTIPKAKTKETQKEKTGQNEIIR